MNGELHELDSRPKRPGRSNPSRSVVLALTCLALLTGCSGSHRVISKGNPALVSFGTQEHFPPEVLHKGYRVRCVWGPVPCRCEGPAPGRANEIW